MLNKKFAKEAVVYRTDEGTGELVLDGESNKIQEKSLGVFVFRRPTLRDQVEINIDRVKQLKGADIASLDVATRILIEFNARFPLLIEEMPENCDLNDFQFNELLAVSNAFNDGLDELFDGSK